MTTKLSLTTFTSLTNETTFLSGLNQNFADICAQVDLLLSRDGEAPNTLTANLDLNTQRLINIADAVNAQDVPSLSQVQGLSLPDIPIPDQTGNAGRVLQTDGTVLSWGPLIDPFAETLLDDTSAAEMRTTLDAEQANADIVKSDELTTFTAQAGFGTDALIDGANIAWNLTNSQVASVTLAGNRTLDNPTNMQDGFTYILIVTQDGAGSRTLAFDTAYLFPNGTAPVLSTGGGDVDIITFVSDGTSMYGVAQLDFS